MRINDGYLSGVRIDRPQDVDPAPAPASRSSAITPQDASDNSSARELAQLVAAVDATEEVRPSLIQDVSRRLAAGEYETDAAAQRTAETMLQAAD